MDKDACCMSCINWRYTQKGTGECTSLNIYTDEAFACKSFVCKSFVPKISSCFISKTNNLIKS